MPTQRYQLLISYRGTCYHGWQQQPMLNTYKGEPPPPGSGIPTIQETLASNIAKVVGHPVVVVGSSRTDAGVHAKGQVAHVDTSAPQIAPEGLRRAVNHQLPSDILIRAIEPVPDSFDAITAAVSKRSESIFPRPVLAPLANAGHRCHAGGGEKLHRRARFRQLLPSGSFPANHRPHGFGVQGVGTGPDGGCRRRGERISLEHGPNHDRHAGGSGTGKISTGRDRTDDFRGRSPGRGLDGAAGGAIFAVDQAGNSRLKRRGRANPGSYHGILNVRPPPATLPGSNFCTLRGRPQCHAFVILQARKPATVTR